MSCPTPSVLPSQQEMEDFGAVGNSDLLEDAKFYQDAATEYQSAYESLKHRYAQQALLMEEASGALQATESQASQRHQELLALRRNRETDIQLAVSHAVSHYQMQLTMAQSNLQTQDHEHQLAITKLKDQVHAPELSLASQANLPSVGKSQSEADLWEEVFNILPGTVNTNWATVVYKPQDQAFSFQKHV